MASPEHETPKATFQWHWNWKVLAFTVFFLPVTLSAGFWQLHRAEEKTDILAAQGALRNKPPVMFTSLQSRFDAPSDDGGESLAQRYLRVIAEGDIHPQQVFLIDNRVQGGRPGYEVLLPMQVRLVSGEMGWLMINRGWIAGGLDRSQLPAIPAMLEGSKVLGYLYKPLAEPLLLAADIWAANQSPLVIQHFDQAKLESYLGASVYPYMLRLEESHPGSLRVDWLIVSAQPEKHTAYAVQWFSMALALLILTVFANSNIATYFSGRSTQVEDE
ncbi:hypothetical protein A9Q89_00425 [Gammaproteobacteria bacterium 53_120_T64]|nr:hypothetical protein A9Q89_00425 [Gammaproteobacteria bacterium 53_120_T64]